MRDPQNTHYWPVTAYTLFVLGNLYIYSIGHTQIYLLVTNACSADWKELLYSSVLEYGGQPCDKSRYRNIFWQRKLVLLASWGETFPSFVIIGRFSCFAGESMMSISELLGLNLPRGPLLGNTSPLGGSSHYGSPTASPSNPFHRSYQASI